VVDLGLAVGGVEGDVREVLLTQRPVAEGGDFGVEVLADPRDLAFGDPRIRAEGLDQVVDLAGGGAVQIGLHHHREQALIDPAAPLVQSGKNDPERSLGIRYSKSPAIVVMVRGREPLR